MAFRPLEEIIGPITLPIHGKNYVLPVLSMEDGLKIHTILAGASPETTAGELAALLLGDAGESMAADGVSVADRDRAFFTALADFRSGREAAELIWENGIPKEFAALVQAAVKRAQTIQQAAETTTPPRVSGTGTKPRRTPAKGSRGKQSLTTGN